MHKEAARLIKKLGLERHPEGGYFRRTYRSDTMVMFKGLTGRGIFQPRSITCSLGQFSEFHRIRSDEIWHHYAGDTLVIYTIGNDGKISKNKIGWSRMPQAVMKTGTWFAAALNGKKSYCLVWLHHVAGF